MAVEASVAPESELHFSPPSRVEGAEGAEFSDALDLLEGATPEALELLEAAPDMDTVDVLHRVSQELSEVEEELALAQRQRELLLSIEAAVADLPEEERAEMLSHVSSILRPQHAKEQERDDEFAKDLMDIISHSAPLEAEERETLRPMAIHAMTHARGQVAVALLFEKLPDLYDDVISGKITLSNTELVALCTSSAQQGLEVAGRKGLLGRLSPLELMSILCDAEQVIVEAVLCEAPQLEDLGAEHLAIFRDRNREVADIVFQFPHVQRRMAKQLNAAQAHWRNKGDPLELKQLSHKY
jgi:hypothetical protein